MRMESFLGTLNTDLYMNEELINKCVGTLNKVYERFQQSHDWMNSVNDSMQFLVRSFSSFVYCNVLSNQRSRLLVVLDVLVLSLD